MQGLGDELWGKQLRVIKNRTFSTPYPGHGFRPEYKVNLKEIGYGAFPDPEFKKGKAEKVFKVLQVRSELPCGTRRRLLVHQKLLAGQPTAFRTDDDECYLFDSSSNRIKTNANYLFDLPKDQKKGLWILTDKALGVARWNKKNHSWFVVLAASPLKVKASNQWKKNRNVASRYMGNWGWDEIIVAFTLEEFKPPMPAQTAMLFTVFTSLDLIARTCLDSISLTDNSAYNRTFNAYLDEIGGEIDTFMAQEGFQTVENSVHQRTSHRIAIMVQSRNRLSCKIRIVTRSIAHKAYEKAQMRSQLMCFELYDRLARQRSLRTVASWMFEAFAHDWFRNARTFEAVRLPIEDHNTPLLEFTTSRSESSNHFMDAKNLATQIRVEGGQDIEHEVIGKYCLPYNANFESVNGLVFSALDTLILLQITISKSHDIKAGGVKKLCELLPTIKNIHIVFIIPEDCENEYSRAQSIPKARDVKPKAKGLRINQFRIAGRQ
ncbi:unnamed protein product [Tuber aestivum]|uniref:Uncharacterized protein n=1 Tax=Tuber aestivum TaxID=59557 RepID=A0A292PR53_9PEZI|nr:unnamed protein product [Tuber aestivum]